MSGSRIVWQRPLYQPIYLHMEIKFDILFPLHHFTVAPDNVGQKRNAFCLKILALVNHSSLSYPFRAAKAGVPLTRPVFSVRCFAREGSVWSNVQRNAKTSRSKLYPKLNQVRKKRCTYVSLYLFSFFRALTIEFLSDDVTKTIFLKLWVLFNCSEQPIWKKFTREILAV